MKYFFLLYLAFVSIGVTAQNPAIVKVVGSTITQPSSTDQEGWKNNEWNGLFFYQGTGSSTKLCVTDGTTAGTQYLADIGGGTIVTTIPAQDFMYIITNRLASFSPFAYEAQIWKSNGTAAGTLLVYTMPLAGISNACVWTSDRDAKMNFSVSGNVMFFNGYDATNGNELWVTDGTTVGTHIVKDINAGVGSSSPLAFCKIGLDIFFTAIESSGRKLWKTDGTAVGTTQIAVAEPFFILDNAVGIVNNKMIFYAHNTVDGYEPYVSDGTAAGTYMLKNINPSGNSWITQSQNAHLKFNNKYCFFIANNGITKALWRTDGTATGTIQLTTDAQNASSNVSGGSYTEVDANGLWMIEYNTSGSGNNEKLYRSNGTPQGTYLAASNLSYAQYIKSYKGALWMQSRDIGSAANTEPWRCGGNTVTTNKAMEIAFLGSTTFYSSNPFGFFVKADKLYFFATPINGTMNLYQYNGDFTFNGSQAGGRWRDSANWNSMMPPGITDTVFINSGTPNALNINGATAYAGVLNLASGASINFSNTADSLIVHNVINANGNNITGDGVLALKNYAGDTASVNGNITIPKLAILSQAKITAGITSISSNVNFSNNSRFVLNNNQLRMIGTTSSFYGYNSNNYVVTNSTGTLTFENVQAFGRGAAFFPIGTSAHYNLLILQNFGTNDVFNARVAPSIHRSYTGEIGDANTTITNNAVNTTWFINEEVQGGSQVYMIANWLPSQEMNGFNRAQTILGHYTNNLWTLNDPFNANDNGDGTYGISRNNVSSFSPFGVINASILPLKFISFSAQKCNSNQVCLNWKTANEQNVSHFEIERSTDGVLFTKVGTKSANNLSQNAYTTTDDISAIQTKQLYYRIKQVDVNGKTTNSTVQLIKLQNSEQITIYPNPVADEINITNWSKVQKVQLLDVTGKRVKQWQSITSSLFPIKEVAAGVYFMQLKLINGQVQTQKIVKQ
jgi:ELWxxDGT repeat protein